MDQKQSFNLTTDFLNGFSSSFMKFVYAIILIYALILIINFLRDKFINQSDSKKDDVIILLTILNKLFFVAGFGFIIGNVIQFSFSNVGNQSHEMSMMNFRNDWDYLTFGIILIFIGIGLNAGKKTILKDRSKGLN